MMPKSKAQSIGEQVAHFTLLGVALTVLSPFVSIPLLVVREFTKWKLPWVFKGQWPPGDIVEIDYLDKDNDWWAPMDRVEDLRLDVVVTLAGILVGLPLHAWWVWLALS